MICSCHEMFTCLANYDGFEHVAPKTCIWDHLLLQSLIGSINDIIFLLTNEQVVLMGLRMFAVVLELFLALCVFPMGRKHCLYVTVGIFNLQHNNTNGNIALKNGQDTINEWANICEAKRTAAAKHG